MIRITHSQADGTLLDGSSKGDGVLEIVKRHGFRWFPSIRAIGIRGSRDHLARERDINAAAAALRAAGHEVEVIIDNTPRDRATVLADQAERLDDRYDALAAKAQRRAGEAAAALDRADQISQRWEGGQPIIMGHHSTRKALRDREKMHAAQQRGMAHQRTAEEVARRAAAVGSAAAYSERPGVTARRIAKHESRQRVIERDLAGYTRNYRDGNGKVFMADEHEPAEGRYRERLLEELADIEAKLAYDRQLLAKAVEEGRHVVHSKDTLHVGDRVTWGLGWYEVAKVNRTTVRVNHENDPSRGGFNLAMNQIRKLMCPHGEDGPTVVAPAPTAKPLTRPKPELTKPAPEQVQRIEAAANAPTVHAVGYFPTPAALAERVVREAGIADARDVTVLEPSAGDGALVRAVLAANPIARVTAVEPNRDLAQMLVSINRVRVTVLCRRFEELESGKPRVDYVVMNPPFNSPGEPLIWAEHILAAYWRLKPGGRLVAIAPAGFSYRREAPAVQLRDLVRDHGAVTPLPDGSFAGAGTEIRTVLLRIDRPRDGTPPPSTVDGADYGQDSLF